MPATVQQRVHQSDVGSGVSIYLGRSIGFAQGTEGLQSGGVAWNVALTAAFRAESQTQGAPLGPLGAPGTGQCLETRLPGARRC